MDFDAARAALAELASLIAGPGSRLWPVYLAATVLICAAIYRARRIETPFLAWLLPRSVWFHASHIVDLKVFVVNRVFAALGVFNLVIFSAAVATAVAAAFGPGAGLAPLHPALAALALLAVADFCVYWVHRIHHESRVFWPFHSLHHSAEVMTPVTVFRKHPVYDLISSFAKGIFIGGLQGLFLALFESHPGLMTLAGVNAGYLLFNMAGSNLRHSHIWLSFGPVLEHVFISPAQHQIHHSLEPRHHNRNYGEVLAIWDWMFGTLYVPRGEEKLQFGLADAAGNRVPQRHDSLAAAMLVPLRDCWQALRRRPDAARPAARPVTPAE